MLLVGGKVLETKKVSQTPSKTEERGFPWSRFNFALHTVYTTRVDDQYTQRVHVTRTVVFKRKRALLTLTTSTVLTSPLPLPP
jgi:hypothetical protein